MKEKRLLTVETEEQIERILKKGNSVELKRERTNIVVVELQRKVKAKEPLS